MNPAYKKFIQISSNHARVLFNNYGPLAEQNILWAWAAQYQTKITQGEIDSDPELAAAGLTVQNVADALYALALIKTAIDNAMPALTILANSV